jgi:hypothetical protein
LRFEAELVEARRDHAASERALPLRQEEMARLQGQLGALAEQQWTAVAAVIVEIAEEHVHKEVCGCGHLWLSDDAQ